MGKTQRMMDGMLKGFAMLGGAAGIGRFITSTVKSADSLQKLSIKLGTTTDFLSKLQYAANISGVEMNTVSKALEKMQKSASDAGRGLSTARDGFATLGIEVEEFINLSPEQQFQLMIEKLGGVANQSIRTGTAMDLMGRSGAEMLKIVAGGPEVFNELMLKAEDLGGVLKQDAADGAAAVADAFTDVATVWSGLLRDAVLNATDGFIAFANVLRDAGAFVREYSTQIKFVAVVLVELFVIRKITALIVAMSGAMKVATFSARGLGIALKGMLGGIPGLLAMAGTAWLMLRDDTDEATQAIDEQTEAVKELRQQFAGMNLDQLIQRQRELKTEFAEVSTELEQLNQDLEEMRRLMANAPGGKGMIEAARDLQTAIVDAGDAVSVLEDPQLVALQDRYAELEALLAEVEKQIDEVTKSTEESTNAHKKNADAVEEVVKGLTEGDKAAVKVASAIARVNAETIKVEESLTEAEQALKDWGDGVIDAQKESDLLIDKMELLDDLFRDGKISGEVYEDTLRGLGDAFGDAADDGVALVEIVEDTKTVFEDLVDGIDGSWTQMWKDLFGGGKTEDVLKGFLDRVKKMFLDTLAEIIAAWTKKKIIEMITGVVGGGSGGGSLATAILGSAGGTTAGTTAATSVTGGGIGSAITSGLGKIFGSIFGPSTSSGVIASGATATSTAAAGTTAAGAGMSALGFALPLAILGFGLFRSNKIKKMMKKKYRELMSDPSITANLADHALFEHINVLGDQAGQTWVQIGDTASRVLDELTTRNMGVMKLGFREMKDEFGNVLVTANDFSKLMDTLERQKPFLKQADDLVKLHGQMGLAKEGIDLINVELFEADAAFQKMGQAGIDAIMKIDTKSTAYATMMQKGFVTAVQTAQMGIGEFGNISAEVFDTIVRGVQDAEGSMKSLAEAAQLAINRGQKAASLKEAAGFQHGGSFVVGGGGGTDSQRVSFMATPGERVTVETPNQSKASGSDGGNVVRELRALRHDLASVVAKPIVGAVTRGQLAMAGGARH